MPKSIGERIENYRKVIFQTPIDALSFNEWHAIALGTIGYPLGRGQHTLVTTLVTLAAITGYLPLSTDPDSGGIGTATAVIEPWYFCVTVNVTYAIGDFLNRH